MKPYIMSGSSIREMRVHNSRGYFIGYVKDIMIDLENGEVLYAVLSFEGHPDSGKTYFPVPIQVLIFKSGSEWVELDVDEKLLRDAPGFDKYNWPMQPTAQFIASVYDHYGHRPKVYIS